MAGPNFGYLQTILSNVARGSKRQQSVVMLHIGRSGSTVLGDLYNQNPAFFWDSEIFIKNRILAGLRPAQRLYFESPRLVIDLRRIRTHKPVYGFEIKPSQIRRLGLRMPEFLELMNDLDFQNVILLHRKNHLRVLISHLVAKQGGQWHRRTRESLPADMSRQIEIEVKAPGMFSTIDGANHSLLETLRKTREDYAYLLSLFAEKRLLTLDYEDHIMNDPTEAYRRTCAFLGIEPVSVVVRLEKTNPWKARDLLANVEEVEAVLAGSPYAWMLDE